MDSCSWISTDQHWLEEFPAIFCKDSWRRCVCVRACAWGNLSYYSGAQARVDRDLIPLTSDQTTATSHSCVTVCFSDMSLCTWFSWELKQ